ncbi:MAG: hypothetical protein ABF780_03360 [Bifidobacterium aquikefiri]|uniref:Uncharacterized protein n=1 Tax=Bifidobacterium aquikefiri TaxID=1653207 RepID=A0A261G5R2_9BIFI|nr:hypothetical protein [Bifidobacterium aquikefiri]OZG66752.1 hypothetical protein BAQU_0824 [Bifidobacterium aquikefiri]
MTATSFAPYVSPLRETSDYHPIAKVKQRFDMVNRPQIDDVCDEFTLDSQLFYDSYDSSLIQSRERYDFDITFNLRGKALETIRDFSGLDEEERPTYKSMQHAYRLVDILENVGLLDKLQIWPTDNGTIEFGRRIDERHQFVLETGNNGVRGLIFVGETEYEIGEQTSENELSQYLAVFLHDVRRK